MSTQKQFHDAESYHSYLTGKPIAKPLAEQLTAYEQQDLALRQRFLEDFHKIARLADLQFWLIVTAIVFSIISSCMTIFMYAQVMTAIYAIMSQFQR